MTRCRDSIIERSKWLCSVALMSAAGAAVFGVTGADGRGGSHWADAHATSTHSRVVHAASGFSSHVTPVRTHSVSFSSHVTPAPSHTVSASHAVSTAAPATTHHAATHHAAATHRAAAAHKAASTHATKHIRIASSDSFDTTDASTAGAASGALGAAAGSADPQGTTCPTDGSTQTTSPGDTATTAPADANGSDTCSSDSSSGQDTGSAPTGTTTDPTDNTSTTNNGQDNTAPGDNGSGTGTTGSGTDTSGSGTDTSGSGTDTSGSGTDTSGSGTDTSGSGTGTATCSSDGSGTGDGDGTGDGSGTDTSGSNGTTDQLPETNPGVVCPGGSATPGAAGGSSSGSTSGGSNSTGTGSPTITALTNGAVGSATPSPAQDVTPVTPAAPNAPVTPPATNKPTPNNNSTGTFQPGPAIRISPGVGASVNAGTGAARTGTSATTTLGGVSPAATALGLTGGTGTSTSTGTGNGAGSHSTDQRKHNSPSITDPISTVPVAAQALVKFVNHIPEWVWIALAALATVAAVSLGVAFRNGRRVRAQASAIAEVSAAALTDPLTGVLNRRGFTEAMERELARARRYGRPFVLAYVDVRGLKAVNDTEGHLAGDELLKGVAGLLHDSARADDVVGRLGGDELGLLLAEQTPDHAEVVTDRIQSLIPERRAELGLATPWGLTIGTAAYPEDGETFNELLATADRRLYEQRGIELRREPAPRV